MSDVVVIDHGQVEEPAEPAGPFYVWRRTSDGYVGVSRTPLDREGIEPIEALPRWKQARAWVIVERYGFPIDEEVSYRVRTERFEAGNAAKVVESTGAWIAGARLKSQLRELFETGPYDGASVNSRGEIALSGRVGRPGDEPDLIASVVFTPNRG
ncbi:hypothetical protein ABZT26_25805 [Streptomyces sp. NPDC005395]|uniref:hypothetical protein n=1 Tax=Streptomyces sp. NPDC005395 TaxID=3157042 RepID=UPI0033A3DE98